jgi:hypothetical protein
MEIIIKQINSNFLRNNLNRNSVKYIGGWITRSGLPYSGGFTPEQRKDFEKRLGYPDGHLDPSNKKFWDNYIAVKLQGNKPVILNTETPEGEFKYEYCKNHIEVLDGYEDNKPRALYVMINQESEAKKKNVSNAKKIEAIKEFDKMSPSDISKCLRLFKVSTDDMSAEICRERMFDTIISKPEEFMSKWVDNKDRTYFLTIEDAVSKNIIRKSRNVYYYGTDVIGHSAQDTVAYLKDKNNEELYLSIKAEIENK